MQKISNQHYKKKEIGYVIESHYCQTSGNAVAV